MAFFCSLDDHFLEPPGEGDSVMERLVTAYLTRTCLDASTAQRLRSRSILNLAAAWLQTLSIMSLSGALY